MTRNYKFSYYGLIENEFQDGQIVGHRRGDVYVGSGLLQSSGQYESVRQTAGRYLY